MTKICSKCLAVKSFAEFTACADSPDGRYNQCRECKNAGKRAARAAKKVVATAGVAARAAERQAERQARLESDHAELRPSDVGPADYSAPSYDREKKQEYNAQMGDWARSARDMSTDPEKLSQFLSLTAEQERRWQNKRLARAQAIGAARELLIARQFEQIAERVKWPVHYGGYSARPKHAEPVRMQTLPLSDLHVGAKLPGYENPVAFDFQQAGRRLASIARRQAEWKTQYRDATQLNLGFNGDVIEGMLGWADMDNAPLEEQMSAAGYFMHWLVVYLAQAFPRVLVCCEPGNHGRNKLTHPGRATSSKWNAYETTLYKFVARQTAGLPNVKWYIPRAPALVVPLFDHNAVMTHGDTEYKLKSPSSAGGKKSWRDALQKINAENRFDCHVHMLIGGHFHDPASMPFGNKHFGLANGALVPANGHARTEDFDGTCGQYTFESVPGFPYGDNRFWEVGQEHDNDSTLDQIIPPYAWDEFETLPKF